MTSNGTKPICCYIVSETSSLDPATGAGAHVQVGLEELSKAYSVQLILFCKAFENETIQSGGPERRKASAGALRKFYRNWIGWWTILIGNHLRFLSYYRKLKRQQPDVIYERASYLNFNGRMIAKLLKVPHFYEVNGIFFKDNAYRFPAIYNNWSRRLEIRSYRATNSFFVGGLNEQIGIPAGEKAYVIQNGISESVLNEFKFLDGATRSDKLLHCVFVGHVMKHHGIEILFAAMRNMKYQDRIRLHLVGSNFDKIDKKEIEDLPVEHHGIVRDEALSTLLKHMNVGIIPFALDYHSNMKLFLYGAARLTIVVPSVKNFRHIFSEDEVLFFPNGDTNALSGILDELVVSADRFAGFGNRAYQKVKMKCTWPKIFAEIIETMQRA